MMRTFLIILAAASCQPTTLPEEEGTTPVKRVRGGWEHDDSPRATCNGDGGGSWVYAQNADKLRGTSNPTAEIKSGSITITIAEFTEGDAIAISIAGAIFGCDGDYCKISYRFDDGDVRTDHGFLIGDGHNTMTLGIKNAPTERAWVRRLCKAKKLILEVPVYEHGATQFEFDVGGLKWPAPTSSGIGSAAGSVEE